MTTSPPRIPWKGTYVGSQAGANVLSPGMARMAANVERRLGVKLVLVQGIGRGSRSAGTHYAGSADWTTTNLDVLYAFLAEGAIGWRRGVPGYGDGFDPHLHVTDPNDPHLAEVSRQQVRSFRAGRDGLVSNRRNDDPPMPANWAKNHPLTPTQGDDDMPKITRWDSTKKPIKLAADKWATVPNGAKDTSLIHEGHDAGPYVLEHYVHLGGPKLGPNDYVQVRTARYDLKGKRLDTSPVTTYRASEFCHSTAGYAGRDVKVRLEVRPSAATTVVYSGGRAIYWAV